MEFGRLKSLRKLELEENQIKDMAFLNGHGKLQHVNLRQNNVEQIPELYGVLAVTYLNLR